MASTPPLQLLSSPQTPSTPLHGASYERPTRQSLRIRHQAQAQVRIAPRPSGVVSTPQKKKRVTTPESTAQPPQSSLSPRQTPKKTNRKVQVVSPSSPNTHPTPRKTSNLSKSQPYHSSTTTFSEGMLPTPVKTPKKKNISDLKTAPRALFQDSATIEEMAASPHKSRKTKRYNGYSLESFRAEHDDTDDVQIFTDNRDKIPEVDDSPSNPFIDHSNDDDSLAKKVAGTSKRRKVTAPKPVDAQVKEAIRKDDGMVYVFRGKKVFRRFDDGGEEEEEEIDTDDLGLMRNTPRGGRRIRPMKTLTRKSVKPTRLFESEEQKAARLLKEEEEASTDVEDHSNGVQVPSKSVGQQLNNGKGSGKKTSPFDKWPRLKKSATDSSSSKASKRTAEEALDSEVHGDQDVVRTNNKRKLRT